MPADDLKKRIEALNKKPLKNVPEPGTKESSELKGLRRKLKKQSEEESARKKAEAGMPASQAKPFLSPPSAVPASIVYSRSMPASSTPAAPFKSRDFGPSVTLEEAVEGVVTPAPAGPGYYHIEKAAHELEPAALDLHSQFVPLLGHPDGTAVERIATTCMSKCIAPEKILFLDLETTGLSMTPVFLIGTMECTDSGFLFKQYFARDYAEEASILAAFSERMRSVKLVVTFNGKSFDVPFLQNRAVATGVKLVDAKSHLDLLHEARKIYRRHLPNCKLQTLEQYVCGRSREDDIPGAEIPTAYHEFVRTGNANKIGLILQHNLFDLLTMADLMHKMWQR